MPRTRINAWTTDSRPATPLTGDTGYNSTLGAFERWSGSGWTTLSEGYAIVGWENEQTVTLLDALLVEARAVRRLLVEVFERENITVGPPDEEDP